MDKTSSFFQVQDAELQLIQKQSAMLLQKRKNGFNGELKSSGAIIENYVKGMLKKHLPGTHRISSGYVATPDLLHSDSNLIQHDIIITDKRIPPLHSFGFSDIEVVAAEAVCGIVEVKRTLTKSSLAEAAEHLRMTLNILRTYRDGLKSKQTNSNIITPTFNVGSYAPIYVIIALDSDREEMIENYFKEQAGVLVPEFIDLIWVPPVSLSASFATLDSDGNFHYPKNVSRNQNGHRSHGTVNWFNEKEQNRMYAAIWSLLRTWIGNTSAAPICFIDNANYFGFE